MPHHPFRPLPFPTAVILVFLSGLSLDALAQNTIAECGPSLLPLAPCAPFVQGMAASPAQSCCHSLDQLYSQKHTCLCLLLHDSTLSSSFPVNRTLALQLPLLCNLQIDISTCAGMLLPIPLDGPRGEWAGPGQF
ncbi:protein yls3 [Phtheirospermum japonicum]|uniref:Protein yls3 n=1 Tax=Phtheirospermum japonicum TaxID=374723 RepID=A0A830CK52_9LAMI|nr:protein yls3 [Phtheirospermum japonicum]